MKKLKIERKKENNVKTVAFVLSEELFNKMEKRIKELKTDKSKVMRALVEYWLQEE